MLFAEQSRCYRFGRLMLTIMGMKAGYASGPERHKDGDPESDEE
jgi:hypothetical protein